MSYDNESFSHFLQRIGKLRVLTATEEKELAKRIEAGDHAALNKLIEHNIRLAVSVAKKYQHHNVPLEDLVNEGVIGVHRAAVKFDHRRDLKFSTYATWWIRHMVQRAIHRDRATIREPGHIIERRRRIDKFLRENPDANLADAAEELDIKLEQAEEVNAGARVVSSLDMPYGAGEDDGRDRYEMVPDDSAADPQDVHLEADPRLIDAVRTLSPIERRVLELRFGFDGPVLSRDQTAEKLGIRPGVVQRSQRVALAKLREHLDDHIEVA